MRALLFKRLESSIEAFRATLGTLITSNRNFKAALDEGFVPVGTTATRLLSGESFEAEELLDVLQKEEDTRTRRRSARSKLVYSIADFRLDDWLKALDADHDVLSELQRRIAPIRPEDDDKLQELKAFLVRKDVTRNKVLIFSEAETTVEYLFQQLNPDGKDPSIARLSGATRSSVESVVKRFSPGSQLLPGETLSGKEIRVLIATDIVSEGQNLQDCHRVINYDLHWNPVRMIQRFGRVDRIGQDRRPILHNFWPDTALDEEIDLTSRLIDRIQTFHDFIGLDSRILSDSERLNARAMYRIYSERRMPEDEDQFDGLAAHQRGIALLQRIQQDDPELWETITNLPDGIRSALAFGGVSEEADQSDDEVSFVQSVLEIEGTQLPMESPEPESEAAGLSEPGKGDSVVLFETDGVTAAFAVDAERQPRSVTPAQLVAAAECEPATPAATLPEDTNDRVMAAYRVFKTDLQQRLGRSRRPSTDSRIRRWLSRQLNIAREQHAADADELRRITLLRQIFLDHLPAGALSAIRDTRDAGLSGDGLIRRLEALRERFRLSPPDPDDVAEAQRPGIIRIVCSDRLD